KQLLPIDRGKPRLNVMLRSTTRSLLLANTLLALKFVRSLTNFTLPVDNPELLWLQDISDEPFVAGVILQAENRGGLDERSLVCLQNVDAELGLIECALRTCPLQ